MCHPLKGTPSLFLHTLCPYLPRFARLLTENGVLAVVDRSAQVGLREGNIIPRYSLNREYVRWDPVKTIEEMGLFERIVQEDTGSVQMEDGRLQGQVVGSVVWGKPKRPSD